jgi:hypothetical protein
MSFKQIIRQKFNPILISLISSFLFFVISLFIFIGTAYADDTIPLSKCGLLGGQIYTNSCPTGWDTAYTYKQLVTKKETYPNQEVSSNGPMTEIKDIYGISYKTVKYACCTHSATVNLVNPTWGLMIYGMYNLKATASDPVGISHVYFEYLDAGTWKMIGEGSLTTPYTYELSWDTTNALISPVDRTFLFVQARAMGDLNHQARANASVELDNNPPVAVSNLGAATQTTAKWIKLTWTAPADAGLGTEGVQNYDIRYSASPITAENFASASLIAGPCASVAILAPGTAQECIATLPLDNTLYYFAIKSKDNRNQWSGISNVPSAKTLYADIGVDDIEVSKNGQISLFTIYKYDNIDVKAHVTNYGNMAETVTVKLEENYIVKSTQQVNLQPLETKLVSFVWTPNTANTNIPISIYSSSNLGDMNTGNNRKIQNKDVWSVVSVFDISFDAGDPPTSTEPGSTFYVVALIDKYSGDYYQFNVNLNPNGLSISPDETCPATTSVIVFNPIWETQTIACWRLNAGTPGQDYNIQAYIGNVGDRESISRIVHINGVLSPSPTTTLPRPITTEKEPGLPLITSRTMSFSRPLW